MPADNLDRLGPGRLTEPPPEQAGNECVSTIAIREDRPGEPALDHVQVINHSSQPSPCSVSTSEGPSFRSGLPPSSGAHLQTSQGGSRERDDGHVDGGSKDLPGKIHEVHVDTFEEERGRPGSQAAPEGCTLPRWQAALNVGTLGICYGLGWALLFIQVSATTVAAKEWGSTALSLLPYGCLAATHALWAIPAQMLMRRYTPKPFYILGSLCGMIGNAIMILAAWNASFVLLLVGSPFCGFANAYINFLRFEAGRFVRTPKNLPLAISTVVAGGVVGGALGPLISRFTRSLIPEHQFAATYATAVGLWFLEGCLISFVAFNQPHVHVPPTSAAVVPKAPSDDDDKEAWTKSESEKGNTGNVLVSSQSQASLASSRALMREDSATTVGSASVGNLSVREPILESSASLVIEEGPGEGRGEEKGGEEKEEESGVRKWHEFLRNPVFLVSVSAATICYTFMAVFMLTGVIAMTAVQPGTYAVDLWGPSNQAISYSDTNYVIIAHIEAMFIPSFFTGFIIRAVGADGAMVMGFGIQVLSEMLLLMSNQLWNFYLCMALLGLGWNLSFVGATATLSTTYRPQEKDLAQGMNDAITFGVNTIMTVTASLVLQAMGRWETFVLVYACLTVPGLVITCWFWVSRRWNLGPKGNDERRINTQKAKLQGKGSVTSKFRLIAR